MNYTTARLVAKIQALWATRDRGATTVEYALMVALIAIAAVAAVTFLGNKISDSFNNTANALGE
jgi:pilus assembly protein Flp/PilA